MTTHPMSHHLPWQSGHVLRCQLCGECRGHRPADDPTAAITGPKRATIGTDATARTATAVFFADCIPVQANEVS